MKASYRYERVGNFVKGDLKSHVKVTAVYLGKDDYNITIGVVADPDFWGSRVKQSVIRIFPAAGLMFGQRLLGRGQYVDAKDDNGDDFHKWWKSKEVEIPFEYQPGGVLPSSYMNGSHVVRPFSND